MPAPIKKQLEENVAKGKIAEEGNHEQLVSKNGLYKKLWDIQTGVVTD